MDTNTLKRLTSFMGQQVAILKQMLELADDCENRKLTGDLDATELQQLKDYTADMMLACTTAKKLAEQLQPVLEKEDKEKAGAKRTEQPKKPRVKPAPKPKPEKEPDDDDDMDFLE